MGDPQRTVKAILDAAERVILSKGLAKTTLDEVAREASISKGGVLHHFPNKESILVGVLHELIARFESDIESYRSEDTEPAGSFTRAFLRATLKPNDCCVDVFLALFAAFSYTPALLRLHRDSNSRWQRRVEQDGINPVHASMVRFASDGLWLARIHGVAAPSEEIRAALIDSLFALTRGESL